MFGFDEVIDRSNTNALSVEGYGEYLFGKKSCGQQCIDDGLIRMWIADMDFATPHFVLDAIKERLDRKILGYSMIFDQDYHEAFNSWLKKRCDWQVEPEYLQPSPGIVPALHDLVSLLTKEGDKILILTPSYGPFQKAVLESNRRLVCSDLIEADGNYTINYGQIEKIIEDQRVTMFIFCHPHNPTGRLWSEEELVELGKMLASKDIWIISDEIHCDLLRSGKTHLPFGKVLPGYSRIITCMSPSKTFNMAGMMLANIIIPDPKARALWQKKNGGLVNPLAIAGVKAAYSQGEDYLASLKSYLDGNFELLDAYLKANLPQVGFTIPEATYLAWLDLSFYLDGTKGYIGLELANQAGILVESGRMFVQNGDNHIRLNLAVPREVLAAGLQRLGSYFNKIAK
ncbi:MAG: PatB family C-S lyase [Erysipelotrichaceae bacterium]|nr:PatB family C-S lyase [Erysipelotrichaceae bacterium]